MTFYLFIDEHGNTEDSILHSGPCVLIDDARGMILEIDFIFT